MPYEMVITQASDLTSETIGFGEDQSLAESTFNWTTNALMHETHILIGNVNHPYFIEVVQRRGATLMFIELNYRPPVDMRNILWLIRLLASEATDATLLAKGMVHGEVLRSEQLWATAQYIAMETNPKGVVLKHALPGDRIEAKKAFAAMVQERVNAGEVVRRNQDALMKYSAMGADGLTTFEFVERVQK